MPKNARTARAGGSDTRFALAFLLIVPSWIGAMCMAFLARGGWRALWLCSPTCGLLAIILGLG